MIRATLPQWARPTSQPSAIINRSGGLGRIAAWAASVLSLVALLYAAAAAAQVMTIDTNPSATVAEGPIDRQYAQIQPTHVALSKSRLDPKTGMLLIRALQSEQGFAMRPLPQGHKGLKLVANGKLYPAGEAYVEMAVTNGISARPGDRVVITDVKIVHSMIVFDLNGGPDLKHRILSHISIGMGPEIAEPVVQQNGDIPTGARVTLAFKGHIPELTGKQVEDLLAPLISFGVKTPVQAFTDTLPKPLKEAILNHQVWVGMSTEMVLYSLGRPWNKYRAMDGQMPYEDWVYGHPPQTTTFVRINGNRVIRVAIAPVGKPMEVFTKDVVSPMMLSNGSGELADSNAHVIREGDVQRRPTDAPAPPPTLLKPGEKPPSAIQGAGQMRPVYFPKDQQEPPLGANPDDQQPASAPAAAKTAPAKGAQASTAAPPASTPAGSSPSTSAKTGSSSSPQASPAGASN